MAFGGLTSGERASAVMSGVNNSKKKKSNKISLFGAQEDKFVDFTNPNERVRDINPQQLKQTAERIHSDARTSNFKQKQQVAKTAREFEQQATGMAKNKAIGRNLFGVVDRRAQSQLRQAQARGDSLRDEEERVAEDRLNETGWSGMQDTEEQQILQQAATGMRADKLAEAARRRAIIKASAAHVGAEAMQVAQSVAGAEARFQVGRNVGQAVHVGMRQQVSFSKEQAMLGQMFGQGEKIWGTNNQPVVIHNDLNSSRSDPWDETSSMFGFGDQSERSGLF